MHVTEGQGRAGGRNLALDFMPGWPALKSGKKKRVRSYFFVLSGFFHDSFRKESGAGSGLIQ